MKPYPVDYLLQQSAQRNILPLTSVCNSTCIFCSHRGNPPGVVGHSIGPRSLDDIRDSLLFIDPIHKIVIGESVTTISEGEPLTHPQFCAIIALLRAAFPKTTVQITTNAILAERETIAFLAEHSPIELNISLNCISSGARKRMMNDNQPERALRAVELLHEYGLPFHGSMVAMPWITDWDEIDRTVDFLAQWGARTIRVFCPGFTNYSPPGCRFDRQLATQLQDYVGCLRRICPVPLLVEPPMLTDLQASLIGTLPDSPAAMAGLQYGDVIEQIDHLTPLSRVDAFHQLQQRGNPLCSILRDGQRLTVGLQKRPDESSGAVMEFDLEPEDWLNLTRLLKRVGGQGLLMVSAFAYPLWQQAVLREGLPCNVWKVDSRFFGGSIGCAGLLTVSDFEAALSAYLREHSRPAVAVLPAVAFDCRGYDLTMDHVDRLQQLFDINIQLL